MFKPPKNDAAKLISPFRSCLLSGPHPACKTYHFFLLNKGKGEKGKGVGVGWLGVQKRVPGRVGESSSFCWTLRLTSAHANCTCTFFYSPSHTPRLQES